ncbi:hypothetical protein EV368DRAFT_77115 [Lentinula lateritia]|nr:hypothetical protein EV368DRAFT_77115 [Lentinula lateritia]
MLESEVPRYWDQAHYSCIEAQGRGSLHCYMMIWLEGGLNPNDIKQCAIENPTSDFCVRLIQFSDDSISNCVPPLPNTSDHVLSDDKHPCSVRGTMMEGFDHSEMASENAKQKDVHNIVMKCQVHTHSRTCYKYWKGSFHPKECRFGLEASNTELITHFNPANGKLILQCLDGLINNFNEFIIRCNMDIKFIGSGASAKAVLYYITNYITKLQLKARVAFAALERAVRCLDEQVDHFTSHSYHNLYWTSIERFLNSQLPLPECVVPRKPQRLFELVLEEENESTTIPCTVDAAIEKDVVDCEIDNQSDNKDDEVTLTLDNDGSLVAKATALGDYRFRPHEVEDLCLWEAVA